MNDLLAQFLIECRELVDAATADLLALEQAPEDRAHLDGAFRGFHTLKGAAGIVEFPAMGTVLHAAEDNLAAARKGERAISGDLIGDLLTCLDQVGRWLDEIDGSGDIPAAPDAAADALLARLTRDDEPVAADWLAGLLARHPDRANAARTALRVVPDPDCFFRGDDPLALLAQIPGLLAVDLTPREPWPALEELDLFSCNLVIEALTEAAPEAVSAVLRPGSGQSDIRPVGEVHAAASPDLPPEARAVLDEQLLLAANAAPDGFAGRLASAAAVAGTVLARAGRSDAAAILAEARDRAVAAGGGEAFIAAVRSLLDPPAEPPIAVAAAAPRTQTARALRVDMERIDALVALAGELLVAKNAVGHTARLAQEGTDQQVVARALKEQHALLDRLVSALQRSILAIRVLPLRHVFQHFPRLVREISRDLGKSVALEIEGEATEADKTIVEALFEPLLHVVRNALDHGVEPEAGRRAAGKPPVATLRMAADRDGDQVSVTISDDGRGIDTGHIRRVAAARGIASAATLRDMTEQAVTELIFTPGFSTATAVTDVSGRGVGMDAVRSAIARLGGQVEVTSLAGAGTSVRITLPFSVMLLRVMTVEAGGQVFGIPLDAVIETAVIPREHISRLGSAEAIVLRDRTLPLIRLADTLDLVAAAPVAPDGAARVVVAAADGQTGALEVDRFGERMDVMLKPMDGLLAGVEGFAGTTLLGDGRVLIVLNPRELFL